MGKILYEITEADAKRLREKMKETTNKWAYRRLLIVALRGEGKKDAEIAEIVKIHPDSVRKLTKRYVVEGIDELAAERRKGGNHRNMSREEEEEFLRQYKESAEKGQMIDAATIARAYDEYTGKEHKSKSTMYYLLHKSGWRKVMPRSKHPGKASEEAIVASKKLTKPSSD
jgi:transposase